MRTVLRVAYRGEPRMVGKVFEASPAPDGEPESVFYHAESGNQWHIQTDSPGGLDEVVIEWLRYHGVQAVHHHHRKTGTLYVARLDEIELFGIPAVWDSRLRIYLPRSGWAAWQQGPWYRVPWITQIVELEAQPSESNRYSSPEADQPEPEPEPPQRRLFE